ncbi:MAG: endolytic transglycosylase MltG [Pseudomonadota bacterium]
MNKPNTDLLHAISLYFLAILSVFIIYLNFPFIFQKNNTCIFIHKQESFNEFTNDAVKNTRYVTPIVIKIYSKFSHLDRHLEAGEYCFSDHDSIISMMKKIGRAGREVHKFTLVDGWTYEEMVRHLMLAPSLSDIEILNNQNAISDILKLSEKNLEGQFYPDTYYYAYPDTALKILQQAHNLMEQRVQALYKEPQAHGFYKNSYELLIAASIIQKESNDPMDQMFVASVLVNRMKQHMKLQMDPTVIYGLADRHLLLTKQDLKFNSPYNTYLNKGLPPTPICMPGETALFAAAHPKDSSYIYYVSKKNGTHQFSETLAEQTKAINQYLLNQRTEEKPDERDD